MHFKYWPTQPVARRLNGRWVAAPRIIRLLRGRPVTAKLQQKICFGHLLEVMC